MSVALFFWILWLISVILAGWATWPLGKASLGTVLIFVLIGLLGWKTFGPLIK